MPKNILVALYLTVILLTAFLVYRFNTPKNLYKLGSWPEADRAINQAQNLYETKIQDGESFDDGSCLSNDLLPNWVADIVHDPRDLSDDLPENQCPAYLEGRANHIIELSIKGELIRVL